MEAEVELDNSTISQKVDSENGAEVAEHIFI